MFGRADFLGRLRDARKLDEGAGSDCVGPHMVRRTWGPQHFRSRNRVKSSRHTRLEWAAAYACAGESLQYDKDECLFPVVCLRNV